MSASILLTRAKSANAILKEKLISFGYDLLECSLIEYELLPFDSSILGNYQDIVVTSNFVANHIPEASESTKYAWVVGEKSSEILKEKGYQIKFCAQNAVFLKKELIKINNKKAIYLSGNQITVDMPQSIERNIFYNTHYKKALTKIEIQNFKNRVDYILLYSENCAKTLLQLLLENDLVKYLENTTIVAISYKVGRVVENHFKNLEICNGSVEIIEFLEKINDR